MALTDHVAILLGHSLHEARLNKKKTRKDFYAQFAFPPAAINDLAALVAERYPNTPLNSLEVNIQPNAKLPKPFVGVPDDYYVVRLASTFPPDLFAADGVTMIPVDQARSRFFAGMKVRVHSSAWDWKNEFGKSGASFNLLGVMDAGVGGDKLAIGGGQSSAAFKTHANPNAVSQGQNPGAAGANPFGGATNGSAAAAAQSAGSAASATGASNPFQQNAGAAAQSANPFA